MAYAASLTQVPATDAAIRTVCDEVLRGLEGRTPALAVAFVGGQHVEHLPAVVGRIQRSLKPQVLLTCTCEGVAGGGVEVESGPGLSLWAGTLPGAELEPFQVQFERTPDGIVCDGLPEPTADLGDVRAILLLADPTSCPIHVLLERVESDYPGIPLIGGMASFWRGKGDPKLGLNDATVPRGAVGVIVRKGPLIRSVVSQGCRPIGGSFLVTKAESNVIFDLGGKAALSRLEQTYAELSDRDRLLIRDGLHVGIAIDEYKEQFTRGDFLISSVMHANRDDGAITITNLLRTGQTVQFHVRDAEAASEDLRHLLQIVGGDRKRGGGALLFSCNGRGSRLFSVPDHDAGLVQELCGPLPLAGFFARGELGPIGRRNFIHGFTASIALFEDDSD